MYYHKRFNLKYHLCYVSGNKALFLDKVAKIDFHKNLKVKNARFFISLSRHHLNKRSLYKQTVTHIPNYKNKERTLLLLFVNF